MKNLDKYLIEILKDWEEIPSSRCWQSIENQLSTLPNTSLVDNKLSTPPSSILQKGSSFLGKSTSFWIKTTLIVVATTAVVYTLVKIVSIVNNSTVNPPKFVIDNNSVMEKDSLVEKGDTLSMEIATENAVFSENEKISSKLSSAKSELRNLNERRNKTDFQPKKDFSLNDTIFKKNLTLIPSVDSSYIVFSADDKKREEQTMSSHKETVITTPKNKNLDPVLQEIDDDNAIFNTPPPIILEIPNTITPNGDGINDVFEIIGIEQCSYSYLSIKNSSGKEIFQSSPYQNNWGSDAEKGLYYFYLLYTIHGVKEYRNGILHVIK